MSEVNVGQSKASNVAGGCSLGCASLFVLAGVVWPLLHAIGGTLDENIMMFLPLLIGFPSFIVAHILAIVAIRSKNSGAKKWGKGSILAMWSSAAISILILLIVPEPSKASAVGIYAGSYQGIQETLDLRTDSSFRQTVVLPSGESLTATGTWDLIHHVLKLDKNFVFIDKEKNRPLIPPKEMYGVNHLYLSKELVDDWGSGTYILKRR